jgi:hypothetical protein
MIIADIQNNENLQLVTDSQDIAAIANYFNVNPESFGCMFVEILDGEYGKVYGCYNNIPYLHYELEQLN